MIRRSETLKLSPGLRPRGNAARRRSGRAVLRALGLAGACLAGSADAQEAQPGTVTEFQLNPQMVALGEQIWKLKATCRSCHGALGNGIGDIPQEPQGANFRETLLTPEQFEEVIQCGRPGTAMPHFDSRAYQDDRCYGLVSTDLGTDTPPFGGNLSPRERDALTQFVFANFVGKPPATFEDCIAFWGEDASTCTRYPKAVD